MCWNRDFTDAQYPFQITKDYRKNVQEMKTVEVGDSLYRPGLAIILIFNEVASWVKFLYWTYAKLILNAYIRKHSCKNN